jgi:hypothetical protein
MAHFARLDENNTVISVIVVDNKDVIDADGNEVEAIGIAFCENLLGGTWKQTSYHGHIRKNYAGIGYTYDEQLDAFVPPKPWPSWVLDQSTALWTAPVPRPSDGGDYQWDEDSQSWILEE